MQVEHPGTGELSYVDLNRQRFRCIWSRYAFSEEAYYLTALKVINTQVFRRQRWKEGSMPGRYLHMAPLVKRNLVPRRSWRTWTLSQTCVKVLNTKWSVKQILRSGRHSSRNALWWRPAETYHRVKKAAGLPVLPRTGTYTIIWNLQDDWIERMRTSVPESFQAIKMLIWWQSLGLSDYDANQLTATKVSDFFEAAVALSGDAWQVLAGSKVKSLNSWTQRVKWQRNQGWQKTCVRNDFIIEDGIISSKIAKESLRSFGEKRWGAREYIRKSWISTQFQTLKSWSQSTKSCRQ